MCCVTFTLTVRCHHHTFHSSRLRLALPSQEAWCPPRAISTSAKLTQGDGYLQVREGLYYNPYFPGGAIAMPKMLADEGTEYDDGTVATEAQQAKASFCSNTRYARSVSYA